MTAEEIFLKAIEKRTPAEREAFLDGACGDNGELRAEVESLLDSDEEAGSFLDQPLFENTSDTIDLSAISERPGSMIGPHKLLQKIGEGGFGVVYMADQTDPVRRRVALKIIKPGMDTGQVIARFEAERQALAMMDHPNIAKVLDAGTTESGRPYFVMELVKGVPITQFCDEKHLAPQERLKLFVPVCHALQHAHQKGIIHRDIKPSNVLVGEYDDRAVPRIIDFGVAKATEQKLTEKTMFTQFGQILGTVDYMSPEQAKLNELDIDTRSDIYSLGVLLYELLTGETPFDRQRLRSAAFDELLKIIREEDPPKPSLRIGTSNSLPLIAANRNVEPRKLSLLIRGDLDWIVMKSLDKNRSRRYATAKHFADDVQRFLEDEPVEARAPSTFYRCSKLVKKHRAAVATVGTFCVAVIIAAFFLYSSRMRAEKNEERALRSLERSLQAHVAAGEFKAAETVSAELLAVYSDRLRPEDSRIARVTILRARALVGLGSLQDGVDLVETVYAIQKTRLGADSEATRGTAVGLAELCSDASWSLALPANAKRESYDRALQFAKRCVDLNTERTYQWSRLGLANYRLNDLQAAMANLGTATERDSGSGERTMWLLSMVHWKLGNKQAARDCYAVAKYGTTFDDSFRSIRIEAEALLGADDALSNIDLSSPSVIEACTRLLRTYPRAYFLYKRLSGCCTRLGDWKGTASNLGKAIELDPAPTFIHYEGWLASLLQAGDDPTAVSECPMVFEKFRNQNDPSRQIRLAMLCCLVPSAGIDPQSLEKIVLDAELKGAPKEAVSVTRRMIAYRSGRFEKAATLPLEYAPGKGVTADAVFVMDDTLPLTIWKKCVFSLAFAAMAREKLGDKDEAKRLLAEARWRAPTELPANVLSRIRGRYEMSVWCLAQASVREAEELIGVPDVSAVSADVQEPEDVVEPALDLKRY